MVAKRKPAKKTGSAASSKLKELKTKLAKQKAEFKKMLKKEVAGSFKKGYAKAKDEFKKLGGKKTASKKRKTATSKTATKSKSKAKAK